MKAPECQITGWWEALWPDPLGVLTDLGVGPGMSVVDLCCGDGWFTFPLARIAGSVVAIDIDVKMIEAAKVRFAERGGASNCTFAVADACDLTRVVRDQSTVCFWPMHFTAFPKDLALRELSMMFSNPAACSQ